MDELQRLSTDEFKATQKTPIVVILENVRSMHNVGSVFRTADAFLIEKICLCGYTPRPPHRDIHKTALGATETVAWEGFDDTSSAIEQVKANGYSIYAIEQTHNSIMLDSCDFSQNKKLALVFGNEAEGVEESTLNQCDGSIEIPQRGSKHSLNVSVAAGIVMWQLGSKL